MSNNAESDVVHMKAGEHLPAMPVPSPTIEILKQLLEQMLENERRRLRNEYVRITMLFLVLLAVAIGGGLWFTNSLLVQLHAERQTADRSLQALLQRIAPEMSAPDAQTGDQRSEVRGQPALRSLGEAGRSAIRNQQSEISNTSTDTDTVQAQADIKRLIADLEAKKQALADMLKSQNAQTINMLQSRDSELQILHERMKEVQRKIMNAAPPETRPVPVKKAEAPTKMEELAADSLTVITSNAVTLRLPIPAP